MMSTQNVMRYEPISLVGHPSKKRSKLTDSCQFKIRTLIIIKEDRYNANFKKATFSVNFAIFLLIKRVRNNNMCSAVKAGQGPPRIPRHVRSPSVGPEVSGLHAASRHYHIVF